MIIKYLKHTNKELINEFNTDNCSEPFNIGQMHDGNSNFWYVFVFRNYFMA